MIGRLLHLGSGGHALSPTQSHSNNAPSRPVLSLDSVQEDVYTRDLLFPDLAALHPRRKDQVLPLASGPASASLSTSNVFDYSDDVDLDHRDVRVIVMQDALGPANASLLFDSHPLPEPSPPSSDLSPSRYDPKRSTTSPSKTAHFQPASRPRVIQPDPPKHRPGAFDRRASVHGRSQSHVETDAQRAARRYREELATFSSCVFGNSELMAYKGTSTKVHIVPSGSRLAYPSPSIIGDGRSSIGRSSTRSSKLSQSFSSQAASPTLGPPLPPPGSGPRHDDRKKILITRLFPVVLPAEDAVAQASLQSPLSTEEEAAASFPFPSIGGDDASSKKRRPQPRQRRTPMYAVVLIIQIPRSPCRLASVPSKSGFRESGSYHDQDVFSSSYSSARADWNMSTSGIYGDVSDSSCSVDVEDRIDLLTQHWDVIMRTLTHLHSLVATIIHTMLRQADVASPGPSTLSAASNLLSRTPSLTERRGGGHELPRNKSSKGTTKLVSLWPNSLATDATIAAEVGLARTRIVTGLVAARVVTGQGRWGMWRDEAIWTSKWAAAVNRRQFFCRLLTGFLATHTDWMQALGGSLRRKRAGGGAAAGRRAPGDEDDLSLPSRTVIVSDDKMAARRMIFLLSAFLPAAQQTTNARACQSLAATSVGAPSASPPTFALPVLREESLRRKINRRSGPGYGSHLRAASQGARAQAPPSLQLGLSGSGVERDHQRRASDATSIRSTTLLLPRQEFVSRKSSAATMAISPDTTTPHFSGTQHGSRGSGRRRPGSSGSAAAEDLKRTLSRGGGGGGGGGGVGDDKRQEEGASISSPRSLSHGLRWGALMSGLWGTGRRDSIDSSTQSQGGDGRWPVNANFGKSRPSEAISEAAVVEEGEDGGQSCRPTPRADAGTGGEAQDGRGHDHLLSLVRMDRTPDPAGALESPVRTSINAEDGVIDVDIAFPDYIASLESAVSSPSSSGYLSTQCLNGGLDSFEHAARFGMEGDSPMNTAGWLKRFHPDFSLQALPPQERLLERIKATLRAEPTPTRTGWAAGTEPSQRWVDVGSVVVADSVSNTITRLVYRRLVKVKAPGPRHGGIGNPWAPHFNGVVLATPSALPPEHQFEEEWIEEPIYSADEALAEALDKVVQAGFESGRSDSSTSSQTAEELQGSLGSGVGSAMADGQPEAGRAARSSLEVPRLQCKTVILSTLEEMVREAVDGHEAGGEETNDGRSESRRNLLRDAVRQWAATADGAE